MLQTMRNHLELHLLSKFPLTFHIFVLRMQRGIFQHAANFFCQNLCHQKSFKTFLGRVVYFILVQESRMNFYAIKLWPNEMIFWVLRREIRCSANISRHEKGIFFVTTWDCLFQTKNWFDSRLVTTDPIESVNAVTKL